MATIILPAADPIAGHKEAEVGKVDSIHPAVTKMMARWEMVRDCIEGEETVKKRGSLYLPQPNSEETTEENDRRYQAYKTRAVFYNVTGRTVNGLIGQAFALDPVIKLPEALSALADNVDGSGVSLGSQAEQGLHNLMAYGRFGLLTDYPETSGAVTRRQQLNGEVKPNIIEFSPFSIINWRTRVVGSKELLSLVVLAETYPCKDDGFEIEYADQWRVLTLTDSNEYRVQVYRREVPPDQSDDPRGSGPFVIYKDFMPTDAKGETFKEIPFKFVGSLNNNTSPDQPPLYDMAVLNIAHYRNSADYEEACFMVGQPTPWVSGITKKWQEDVFKDKKIYLGSRAIIPLPDGGQAGLLQVTANSMPFEAMKQKEAQMTALGAKLVEPSQVQRTLGEARLEEATEASILVTCVKNLMAAYKEALKWAAEFQGANPNEITFEVSTDFAISRLEPNERVALMNEWINGGITTEEYRSQLRKAGIATVEGDKTGEIKRPEQVAATPKSPTTE